MKGVRVVEEKAEWPRKVYALHLPLHQIEHIPPGLDRVLAIIAEHGPIEISDICRRMGVPVELQGRQYTARMCRRLANRGYIQRIRGA